MAVAPCGEYVTSEHVRQAILKEMGIVPWFARSRLAGAAPSHPQVRAALREEVRSRAAMPGAGSGTEVLPERTPISGTDSGAPAARQVSAGMRTSAQASSPATGQSGERTQALQDLLQGSVGPGKSVALPGEASVARKSSAGGVASQDGVTPSPSLAPPQESAARPAIPGSAEREVSSARSAQAPSSPKVEPQPGVEQAQQQAESVHFAFSWLDFDEHLAILAELPPDARNLAREVRQMAINIAAALHTRYRQVTPKEHSFHWPFIMAPDMPTDKQAAQQAVDGFMSRQLKERKVSYVLVLSDELPFFLAHGLDDEFRGELSKHARYGFAILQTTSLYTMQSDPASKRTAWQAMQPLLRVLATSEGI